MVIHSFRGGIHPAAHGKERQDGLLPVREAAPPKLAAIFLSQGVGAPCKPLVKTGQRVLLGEKIGEPAGFVGAPIHSPVSGRVRGTEARPNAAGRPSEAIVIENDGLDERCESLAPVDNPLEVPAEKLLSRIREAGIVGMGGAGFPAQVKLTVPREKQVDVLILNGAECEPYLSGDHHLMIEAPHDIRMGAQIAAHILGAKAIYIGVEANKPQGISALRAAAQGTGIEVCSLRTRYPQGGEKQLIYALTGRRVPSGGLPMDVGCVVLNVSTAKAICDAVVKGERVLRRVVTVTGEVAAPANLYARIGTPVGELVEACGGALETADRLILGGPMMGMAAFDLNTPVAKTTGGIVLLPPEKKAARGNCIRCARCVDACPMGLMPTRIARYSDKGMFEEAKAAHALDCIECGCCAYVCPAHLPLTQSIRAAKRELARRKG